MEACAVGGALGSVAKGIKAAQDLVVACEGAKTIAPVPTPKPAPKRDVTCASLGDPHMRYFDGTGNDFQSRGEFILYKNSDVVVQVRQGVHLTIPTNHWAYPRVSTNNAFAIEGTWTCGVKYEVYATQPQKMIVTKNGQTTVTTGLANMINEIKTANCPTVSVAAGNIVEFSMGNRAMRFRFQVNAWGINLWVDLKGDNYLDTDTGICTKRSGGFDAIGCDVSIFSEYPNDNCDDVEVKQIDNEETECDTDLENEAKMICNACPNVVNPKDCVFEACALKTIDAARALLESCNLDEPLDKEECGVDGFKVNKKGSKKLTKAFKKLSGRSKTDSACACADGCEAVGATEWMWSTKNQKCKCFKNVQKIKKASNKNRIVGTLDGSVAKFDQ